MSTTLAALAINSPAIFAVSASPTSSADFMSVPTTANLKGPIPSHSCGCNVKARATCPTSPRLPDSPGIYKFEIGAGPLLPFYIGETTSLRSRMNAYGEMVRALVALHEGCAVRLDINPYRFVHYALAVAVLAREQIVVRWSSEVELIDTTHRKREELLSLALLTCDYNAAGQFSRVLNCWGNLAVVSNPRLSKRWQEVQAVL